MQTFQKVERRAILAALQTVDSLVKNTLLSVFGVLDVAETVSILDQVMRELRPNSQQLESRQSCTDLFAHLFLRTALKLLKTIELPEFRGHKGQLYGLWLHYDAMVCVATAHECLGEYEEAKSSLQVMVKHAHGFWIRDRSPDLFSAGNVSYTPQLSGDAFSVENSIYICAVHALVRLAVLELESFPTNRPIPTVRSCITLPEFVGLVSDAQTVSSASTRTFTAAPPPDEARNSGRYQKHIPVTIQRALYLLTVLAVLSDQRAILTDHVFLVNEKNSSLAVPSAINSAANPLPLQKPRHLAPATRDCLLQLLTAANQTPQASITALCPGVCTSYGADSIIQMCAYLEPEFHSMCALLPVMNTDPFYLVHLPLQSSIVSWRRILLSQLDSGTVPHSSASIIAECECAVSEDLYVDVDALWFLGLEYELSMQYADAARMLLRCRKECLNLLGHPAGNGPALRHPRHMAALTAWLGYKVLPSFCVLHPTLASIPFARACHLCAKHLPQYLPQILDEAHLVVQELSQASAVSFDGIGSQHHLEQELLLIIGEDLLKYRILSIECRSVDSLSTDQLSRISCYPMRAPRKSSAANFAEEGLSEIIRGLAAIHVSIAKENRRCSAAAGGCGQPSQLEELRHLAVAARLYALLVLEPVDTFLETEEAPTTTSGDEWRQRSTGSPVDGDVLMLAALLGSLGEISAAIQLIKDTLVALKDDSANNPRQSQSSNRLCLQHLLALLLPCALDSPAVLSTAISLVSLSLQIPGVSSEVNRFTNCNSLNRLVSLLLLRISCGDEMNSRVALNTLFAASVTQTLTLATLTAPFRLVESHVDLLVLCSEQLRASNRLEEAKQALSCGWEMLLELNFVNKNSILCSKVSKHFGKLPALSNQYQEEDAAHKTTIVKVNWDFKPASDCSLFSSSIISTEVTIFTELGNVLYAEGLASAAVELWELSLARSPYHFGTLMALAEYELDKSSPSKKSNASTKNDPGSVDYMLLLSAGNECPWLVAAPCASYDQKNFSGCEEDRFHLSRARELTHQALLCRELDTRAWSLYARVLMREGCDGTDLRVKNACLNSTSNHKRSFIRNPLTVLDDELL
jgi:hypothetical protein